MMVFMAYGIWHDDRQTSKRAYKWYLLYKIIEQTIYRSAKENIAYVVLALYDIFWRNINNKINVWYWGIEK